MTPCVCKRDCRRAVLFDINIADIRLTFNKSHTKKIKITNDEEASKLLPPKTDTDEKQRVCLWRVYTAAKRCCVQAWYCTRNCVLTIEYGCWGYTVIRQLSFLMIYLLKQARSASYSVIIFRQTLMLIILYVKQQVQSPSEKNYITLCLWRRH